MSASLQDRGGDFGSIIASPGVSWEKAGVEHLFLGSWCASDPRLLAQPRVAVVPNPWDDRDRLVVAERYCWDLCRRWHPVLVERLNAIHAVDHGLRYWQLLTGSWLMQFVHVVYDRFVIVQDACDIAPGAPVFVSAEAPPRPSLTGAGWHQASSTDQWNATCFAVIAESLNRDVVQAEFDVARRRRTDSRAPGRMQRFRDAPTREFLRGVEAGLGRLTVDRGRRGTGVLLAAGYHFKPRDRGWFRTRHTNLRAVSPSGIWPCSIEGVNQSQRDQLRDLPASDEFERLCAELLADHAPLSLIEAYSELCKSSEAIWGSSLNHCVVDGNVLYESNPPLLEYVSRCADQGYEVVSIQHGGGYGTARVKSEERVEIELADRFLSWGWSSSPEGGDVLPLPSPHLSRLRDRHRGGTKVVITQCGFPQYAYRLSSMPIASQFRHHRHQLERFIECLPANVREQVMLKRYPIDYGWEADPPIVSELRTSWPGRPSVAHEWNRDARLAVVLYPDTAFIEALALNVPSIGLWNPDLWDLREEAKEVFAKLGAAGILYGEPAKAAAKVAAEYEDPRKWWEAPGIQAARNEFLDMFGLSAVDWRQTWSVFLKDLFVREQTR